jgi:hypothetical protein
VGSVEVSCSSLHLGMKSEVRSHLRGDYGLFVVCKESGMRGPGQPAVAYGV